LGDGNYSSAAVLQNQNAHKESYATCYIKRPILLINFIAQQKKKSFQFVVLSYVYNVYRIPFSNILK